MAYEVEISTLSNDKKVKISNDLTIVEPDTEYGSGNIFYTFHVQGETLFLPFSHAYHHFLSTFPNKDKDLPRTKYTFEGKLNVIQNEIKNEVYEILNRTRSVIISLFCGGGKTIFSIFLASQLKYKTAIICHRLNIIDQWEYSIHKVCPNASVQIVNTSCEINDVDFYIINVSTVQKRNMSDFYDIGMLIVDEAHCFTTEKSCQSFFWFQPKYCIGLTATPFSGNCQVLFNFFGPELVKRDLFRCFNVYCVDTCYKITASKSKIGKLDWHKVLDSQCKNNNRNMLITNIIRYFKNRKFLVLCKQTEQSKILFNMLKELNEDVEIFYKNDKHFNRNSRILISTCSKTGVGFDHPQMDGLILGSDIACEETFIQYLGRVFRREDVSPIIFDLVDNFFPFKKHFNIRKSHYVNSGGYLYSFKKTFPEFFIKFPQHFNEVK